MVAPAVPRLDYRPSVCLARPMLFASLACCEKGDYIGAGVRLRESVARFVKAACEWYGCEIPKRVKFPKPADYIRALRSAKQLDKWGAECLLEMVTAGNVAAHCGSVDRRSIRGGIAILFSMMDGESYCGHERKPIVTSHKGNNLEDYCDCDDDDDDPADFWKREGGGEDEN